MQHLSLQCFEIDVGSSKIWNTTEVQFEESAPMLESALVVCVWRQVAGLFVYYPDVMIVSHFNCLKGPPIKHLDQWAREIPFRDTRLWAVWFTCVKQNTDAGLSCLRIHWEATTKQRCSSGQLNTSNVSSTFYKAHVSPVWRRLRSHLPLIICSLSIVEKMLRWDCFFHGWLARLSIG